MNILDCAIKMENEARDYYEKLAEVAPLPELKSLFSLLAAAEDEEIAALVRMKAKFAVADEKFSALSDAVCVFRPLLDSRDYIEQLDIDPDAYSHVIKQEEESIEFYRELLKQADDEPTRQLLTMLLAEEEKHLSIVENIYSFIESPRTYLAWGEFGNLEQY
jgi:rubrerythrin